MSADTLREEVEKAMQEAQKKWNITGQPLTPAFTRLVAIAVAVEMVERERAHSDRWNEANQSLLKRAEAAERHLKNAEYSMKREAEMRMAAERERDAYKLLSGLKDSEYELAVRERDEAVADDMACQAELEVARKALAERGHVARCECKSGYMGRWGPRRPKRDPRCAPEKP